jgi:putative radical SAM enzyme (TIGR03279 family)
MIFRSPLAIQPWGPAAMSEATLQPARICAVAPDSIAADLGFEVGDRLVSINGTCPRDLIDYQFLCSEEFLELEVLDSRGRRHIVEIEKDYNDSLGLEFDQALFDGLIQCNNRCPFCFIDQQPPGKRDSLYLKDDDYRLSFLYGSYLTLTNLTSKEFDRIAAMRLSPLYVSVHATDPDLRTRLLKNPRAALLDEQLTWFAQQRLQIHAQVVLCPGLNDGPQLERTLRDLAQFHTGEMPAVASVAVVPVGLTRFRPQEDELAPVSPAKAREVIAQVQALQVEFQQNLGSTFAWLADEWFLIGGVELPVEPHYGDYPQIGNGVGSIRQFLKAFDSAAKHLPEWLESPHRLTWVVGNAVELAFAPMVHRFNQVEGLDVNLLALASHYWGQSISVTGLVTGSDILRYHEQHPDMDWGDRLLIPAVMLKHDEAKFLDDTTLETVSRALGKPLIPVDGIDGLIQACIAPS